MSWIKNLFKKKEKIEKLEIVEEPKVEWQECFYCKQIIYEGDRYAKQQGKYFHKKCYKEMKRSF